MPALLLLLMLAAGSAWAQDPGSAGSPGSGAGGDITAYFFWGDGCPHCQELKPVLEDLENRYPRLRVRSYEVWHNKENAELFVNLSESCGSKISGVPTVFIGDEIIVGFREGVTDRKLEDTIIRCSLYGCEDLMHKLECKDPTHSHLTQNDTVVELPFFGKLDTGRISLPLFTFVIALLDGFNPCAMWVLTFLLTLVIYARSRKRIMITGGIFVLTSGLMYFLFMAAWLNFFLLVGYVDVLRVGIALVAVAAGLINVKDFFWYKLGVSLSIPDRYKPKLFEKMRSLVKEQRLAGLVAGTMVLAVFANLVELLCTAGFPAIYTRILTLQDYSPAAYYSYLAMYNLVYVLPLAVIVGVFTYTMGSHRFTEKQGRILKIIGGLLMLLLGFVLLFKPGLLNF